MSKTQGIFKDPWRTSLAEPAPTEPAVIGKDAEPDPEDFTEHSAQITVPNFGGINVRGANSPSTAAAAVLNFLVTHQKLLSDTLATYGVLIAKDVKDTRASPFFIARADGFGLYFPSARNRNEACLQLVNALKKLETIPEIKAKLTSRTSPYQISTFTE